MGWPSAPDALIELQEKLAGATPLPWEPARGEFAAAGCFVCFPRGPAGPGRAGDQAWAGAALIRDGRMIATSVAQGTARAAYEAGLLALREGPLLEAAIDRLGAAADVVLVDATGRDHRRRAGLALHLGAVLDVPTVGVTHRPLVASGEWPADECGARTPLLLDGAVVGYWVRTRRGTRPLAVHAGWRTSPEVAVEVVLALARSRTPEPLRQARRVAREARAAHRPRGPRS